MMAALRHTDSIMLDQLLQGLTAAALPQDCRVDGLCLDSRKVQRGDLFLALSGTRVQGSDYMAQAVAHGAVACVVDAKMAIDTAASIGVPVIAVPQLRDAAGIIADRFYGHPAQNLFMVGITGTNGKTSVSQFVAQALSADAPCGVVGTLGSGLFGALHSTGHTTPDVITLHAQLANLHAAGAKAVAMEVSSHGLDQQRVAGIAFDVAVFTNLSHEHLDYHGDMVAYALAKRRLFQSSGLQHAVLNLDDEVGSRWFAELQNEVNCIGYGFDQALQQSEKNILRGSNLKLTTEGLSFDVSSPWGSGRLVTGLLGRFNASNLLAALGVLLAKGLSFELALERLNQVRTVPGRMERFAAHGRAVVVVDYAHTPDALEKVLEALRAHCQGSLWCVFGCGGDRDRAKRPLMGQLAESLADRVVLTDDNPRSEDPAEIIADIQRGMKEPDATYIIRDRAQAIAQAIAMSGANDIVLVAGKGHETEQLVGTQVLPFSDRDEVVRNLGGTAHG